MSAKKYPKIDTLYTRDEKFKVTDEIRRPEFLVPAEWLVTEKIDGTNIRISLEFSECEDCYREDCEKHLNEMGDWTMVIRGRTSRAQIPTLLFEHLQKTFTLEGLKSLWRCKLSCDKCGGTGTVPGELGGFTCENVESYPITLYGEGYGGGIQKGGGQYTSKTKGGAASFRLFDVFIGETWLGWENVGDIASKLGTKTVPLLGTHFVIDELVEMVREGFASSVAYEEGAERHPAEGIMAFTSPPLFNSRGKRLMWKLKHKDFKV